jgi:hypothetical protein
MHPAGPIMPPFDSLRSAERIDQLCDQFEADWSLGRAEPIEALLERTPPSDRRPLLRELIQIELERRVAANERLNLQTWLDRFPTDQDLVYHGFQLTEPRPDPPTVPSHFQGRLLRQIVRFLTLGGQRDSPDPLDPTADVNFPPFRE